MEVRHGKRAYPAGITATAEGFLVSFPDFPGYCGEASSLDEALRDASAVLERAISDCRARGEPLPAPSPRAWGQVLFTAIPDASVVSGDATHG